MSKKVHDIVTKKAPAGTRYTPQQATAQEQAYRKEEQTDLEVMYDFFSKKIEQLKNELAKKKGLGPVLIKSTNTGETGTVRTYEIQGIKKDSSILAQTCAQGATPAAVKGATCLANGQLTVTFDIDPSTDHKVSIWLAAPDKVSV